MVHWAMCISASAGIRHVQNIYMYSDLGCPGFIGFDRNGTNCFLDKHSRRCDHNFVCSSWVVAIAKSVANAVAYAP